MDIFQEAFFGTINKGRNISINDSTSSDEFTSEDERSDGDTADFNSVLVNYTKEKNRQKEVRNLEAEKNAQELMAEEEKDKKSRERKRAKKKRKKNKKKERDDNKITALTDSLEKICGSHSTDSSDELDHTSAFVANVASKKKTSKQQILVTADKKNRPIRAQPGSKEENEQSIYDIDPEVLRARQLAIRGNEMAKVGEYAAAAQLFTDAIKSDPKDYRFYGNRSYCFDILEQYDKALKDAEKVITENPKWPKGFYRRGRALRGLNLYSDAEAAFEQVIKLDKNCEDAEQELLKVRTLQIMDMGFTDAQARTALKNCPTVQVALDSLLSGVAFTDNTPVDVYLSDEEKLQVTSPKPPPPPTIHDDKMNPKNPGGLCSLWVGNLLPEVTDNQVTKLFNKYGTVTSVKTIPEKYCAFINFKDKIMAGRAMNMLQGHELAGQKLKIRFPDNPVVNGHQNLIIRKPVQTSNLKVFTKPVPVVEPPKPVAAPPVLSPSAAIAAGLRKSGPVNGNECYFWRTTGCNFGEKCRNLHLKESKGVDKKTWHQGERR